ncbi:hypothetical protein BR93DRAFT_925412 [Coniochaeta sp. PMI_546]|nr:hypothetical protein BR93DRAFT_925412 [Coniochaeta sp. PMI_546]
MALILSAEEACGVDKQSESIFFSIPIELRLTVYAHLFNISGLHIRFVAGRDGARQFKLTPCAAPPITDEEDRDGTERDPRISIWDQMIYKRRLSSSWGSHWMCEDLAFYFQDCDKSMSEAESASSRNFSSTLRVCKKLYLELVNRVMTTTDFHVTDMQTLGALLAETELSPPPPFSFEGSICPRIVGLSIVLSQPLAFFQAIETISTSSHDHQENRPPPNPQYVGDIRVWSDLPSRLLAQPHGLRRLHIWLDHTGEENWSVVNERAILGPVEALTTRIPELQLVFLLPKAHPRIEDPQRHYLSGHRGGEGSSSRLQVRRFLRQRYRVEDDRVIYVRDFPHSYGKNYPSAIPPAERERVEAEGWRAGVDVTKQMTLEARKRWFGWTRQGRRR